MRTKDFYEKRFKNGQITEYGAIICPYCLQKDDDPMAFSLDDDGDEETDVACEKCGKLMDIKVQVDKTYTTTQR